MTSSPSGVWCAVQANGARSDACDADRFSMQSGAGGACIGGVGAYYRRGFGAQRVARGNRGKTESREMKFDIKTKLMGMGPVSYTHLTLPTNREV